MAFYYCTCSKGSKGIDKQSRGFRRVKADEDGVCTDCGHYAIALTKEVKDRQEMYTVLRLDKEEEENYYINTENSLVKTAMDKQEDKDGLKYDNTMI